MQLPRWPLTLQKSPQKHVSFWQKEASAPHPTERLRSHRNSLQFSPSSTASLRAHASVADPATSRASRPLTEADLTLKLTLADLQSVRDLTQRSSPASLPGSQLASTSNRAAIAEAALKDSQQIVSRQHDALEQTSERLRLNDQQLDLMRNALHRAEPARSAAFYKGLLRFQAFAEHEATHARPPASGTLRSTRARPSSTRASSRRSTSPPTSRWFRRLRRRCRWR